MQCSCEHPLGIKRAFAFSPVRGKALWFCVHFMLFSVRFIHFRVFIILCSTFVDLALRALCLYVCGCVSSTRQNNGRNRISFRNIMDIGECGNGAYLWAGSCTRCGGGSLALGSSGALRGSCSVHIWLFVIRLLEFVKGAN